MCIRDRAAVSPFAEGLESERLGNVRICPSTHLRCHGEGRVGPLGQEPTDEDLAAAIAVDVRGVEERHPSIDRRMQHPHCVSLIHVAPVTTELPAPETHDGDLSTRPAELTRMHSGERTDWVPHGSTTAVVFR